MCKNNSGLKDSSYFFAILTRNLKNLKFFYYGGRRRLRCYFIGLHLRRTGGVTDPFINFAILFAYYHKKGWHVNTNLSLLYLFTVYIGCKASENYNYYLYSFQGLIWMSSVDILQNECINAAARRALVISGIL